MSDIRTQLDIRLRIATGSRFRHIKR